MSNKSQEPKWQVNPIATLEFAVHPNPSKTILKQAEKLKVNNFELRFSGFQFINSLTKELFRLVFYYQLLPESFLSVILDLSHDRQR